MQPCRQTAWRCVINHAFQGIEAASGNYGRLDLFKVSPAIHATMGVKNSAKKLVHDVSLSSHSNRQSCACLSLPTLHRTHGLIRCQHTACARNAQLALNW